METTLIDEKAFLPKLRFDLFFNLLLGKSFERVVSLSTASFSYSCINNGNDESILVRDATSYILFLKIGSFFHKF